MLWCGGVNISCVADMSEILLEALHNYIDLLNLIKTIILFIIADITDVSILSDGDCSRYNNHIRLLIIFK